MRTVSALLRKEKRGPSAQRKGREAEVAGLRRANLGAAVGRKHREEGKDPWGMTGVGECGFESCCLATSKLGVGEMASWLWTLETPKTRCSLRLRGWDAGGWDSAVAARFLSGASSELREKLCSAGNFNLIQLKCSLMTLSLQLVG